MDEIDQLEIDLVLAGYSLPLTGETRIEAIRQLVAKKHNTQYIADRLKIQTRQVQRLAKDNNISLSIKEEGHWTSYFYPRTRSTHLRKKHFKK